MKSLLKKIYYGARRPMCRDLGLVRFLVTGFSLAMALTWLVPALDRAEGVMRLSAAHLVLATQLHSARSHGRAAGSAFMFCKSYDALTCTNEAGWEQGWIAFEDRDGDGVRGRDERILHVGDALPSAFRLSGDLNQRGGVRLCFRDGHGGACRPDRLSLAILSGGSRPQRS